MRQMINITNSANKYSIPTEGSESQKEYENLGHILVYRKNDNDDEEYRASLDKEKGLLLGEDAFLLY